MQEGRTSNNAGEVDAWMLRLKEGNHQGGGNKGRETMVLWTGGDKSHLFPNDSICTSRMFFLEISFYLLFSFLLCSYRWNMNKKLAKRQRRIRWNKELGWLPWQWRQGADPGVVSAITQPVEEMDCVALKLIAVWAEAAQISNIVEMGSHQFGGC